MQYVDFGPLTVSRFIIGGNPFSGFSHQGGDLDRRMVRYFTTERIKATLRHAERLGVNTFLGRADRHISRVVAEYHDQGGTIQWLAQTCPEITPHERSIRCAAAHGASGIYIHGGYMDYLLAQDRLDEAKPLVEAIKSLGKIVGVAGHRPEVFAWARANLELDFFMCSYYNPSPRDNDPNHPAGQEVYDAEDRRAMIDCVADLPRPVIHYKVLAAGRNDPAEAFKTAAAAMRPTDAACIGIYDEANPDRLDEDVRLLMDALG